MNGLPQNVLLNFRLEFPKSDLTICLASGFFFFLASLAREGKIKQITDDKGRDDRRLAKRKKKCFWWNMDIRCHSPFKIVFEIYFWHHFPNCYFLFRAENFAFIAFLACDRASSPGAPERPCSQAIAFPSIQFDGFMCKFCPLLHWPMDGVREFLSVSVNACEISKIKMRRKNPRFFAKIVWRHFTPKVWKINK